MSAPNLAAWSAILAASSRPRIVLEARVVVDPLGVEQLAAGHAALQHDRVQHAATGVQRGAHPGRPRADDDQVVLLAAAHTAPPRIAVVVPALRPPGGATGRYPAPTIERAAGFPGRPGAAGSRPRGSRTRCPRPRPPRPGPAPGLRDEPVARQHRRHVEHADAEHPVPAHEERGPGRRVPSRSSRAVSSLHRVAHLPGPRRPGDRADGGLDAVGGTEPVGEGDVAGAVGRGGVVGGADRRGERPLLDRAAGPAGLGRGAPATRTSDAASAARARWRRRPSPARAGRASRRRTHPIRPRTSSRSCAAPISAANRQRRVPVHHQQAAVAGLAALPRADHLPGVEGAVAAAADDRDVAQLDPIGGVVRHPRSALRR